MDAAAPGRFRIRRHAQVPQRLVDGVRGLDHLREADLLAGIEVEVQVIGPIDVVAARIPFVQVDAAQIHDPEQRGQVVDHRKVDHVPGRVLDRARLDPGRPRTGCALHEEEVTGGAVGIALHHHRAVADVGQQHGRDASVVADEVALGDALLWPKHLREVRQLHHATADLDLGVGDVARDLDGRGGGRRRRGPRAARGVVIACRHRGLGRRRHRSSCPAPGAGRRALRRRLPPLRSARTAFRRRAALRRRRATW